MKVSFCTLRCFSLKASRAKSEATATCPQDDVRHAAQPQDNDEVSEVSQCEVRTAAAKVMVVVRRSRPANRSNMEQMHMTRAPSLRGNTWRFLNQIMKRIALADKLSEEASSKVAGTTMNHSWSRAGLAVVSSCVSQTV